MAEQSMMKMYGRSQERADTHFRAIDIVEAVAARVVGNAGRVVPAPTTNR